jgi:steroid delta-isomerase-like uncharacterized protein
LSFGDTSLRGSCKRRRLEVGEDDGPGRRRLDACCALERAMRLEVGALAAPQARGLVRAVAWKASGAGRFVCVGAGDPSRVSRPHERTRMDHSATQRRLYDLLNAGDIDGFGALLADDFVEHEETPGLAPTKDGVLEFFRMYRAAFPDLRMDPEDVLASGDKVVARVRATGTHEGELMGMPGTGNSVDVQLIDIMRFDEDGLVAEHWGVVDMLAMMQQLGVAGVGTPP